MKYRAFLPFFSVQPRHYVNVMCVSESHEAALWSQATPQHVVAEGCADRPTKSIKLYTYDMYNDMYNDMYRLTLFCISFHRFLMIFGCAQFWPIPKWQECLMAVQLRANDKGLMKRRSEPVCIMQKCHCFCGFQEIPNQFDTCKHVLRWCWDFDTVQLPSMRWKWFVQRTFGGLRPITGTTVTNASTCPLPFSLVLSDCPFSVDESCRLLCVHISTYVYLYIY